MKLGKIVLALVILFGGLVMAIYFLGMYACNEDRKTVYKPNMGVSVIAGSCGQNNFFKVGLRMFGVD